MIHLPFRLEQPHGTIRGDVRIPEGPPPRSAVVVVHGFKGYKDWAFFPWVADRLAADRHAVVSFNMTGSGIGTDPHAFTELEAFAANTYSRELLDLGAVVTAVRSTLLPRPPVRLGILGHSRGGADAVLHAANDPGVDALVTWSAVAKLHRWDEETRREWREAGRIYVLNTRTGQQMPLDVALLEDLEARGEALSVEGAAGRVTAPWLILHGTEDETVDVKEARRLAGACPGARLRLVEAAGHTFGAGHPFAGPGEALRTAMDATLVHFRRHLGPD
ncbi:MAG TPA: alpha/beta fold hydrolase [Longimicrobiales bacterium]|nr:alpha/beta fold hydrolase [Longimicrobiales bacterium]